MHPVHAINRWLRTWWPLFVSAASVVIVTALVATLILTVGERNDLAGQRDQLAEIIERNERSDAGREQRLGAAVDEVEALLVDHFAAHDRNVAEKLNETLARIAALLERPAPRPITAPAAHQPQPAPSSPGQNGTNPTTTTQPPTSTTTTTSPGQSGLCERLPFTPICRSNP